VCGIAFECDVADEVRGGMTAAQAVAVIAHVTLAKTAINAAANSTTRPHVFALGDGDVLVNVPTIEYVLPLITTRINSHFIEYCA
jgi:hypothetical protein